MKREMNRKLNRNWSFDDELNEAREKYQNYRAAKRSATQARNESLVSIYSAHLYVKCLGSTKDIVRQMKADDVPMHDNQKLLLPLIYWIVGTKNKDTAHRWGMVLSLAEREHKTPEELPEFIKSMGGIEECIKAWRKPTHKTTNGEEKSNKRQMSGKFLGVPFQMRASAQRDIRRIARFKHPLRVEMMGKFIKGQFVFRKMKSFPLRERQSR